MRIGCISLVPVSLNRFVAVKCSKGRGIILPGGKINPGETFKECAARELFEETGLMSCSQKLIFQAPSSSLEDFYVLCFLTKTLSLSMRSSDEGEVVLAQWSDLMTSKYKGYYELMKDAYEQLPR